MVEPNVRVTDEMVEAAAEAIFALTHSVHTWENIKAIAKHTADGFRKDARAALEAALSSAPPSRLKRAGPEPVAWRWIDKTGCLFITGDERRDDVPPEAEPLYASPPARHSDEEVERVAQAFQDAFTNGNATWEQTPEHHKVAFREGARAALSSAPVPPVSDGKDRGCVINCFIRNREEDQNVDILGIHDGVLKLDGYAIVPFPTNLNPVAWRMETFSDDGECLNTQFTNVWSHASEFNKPYHRVTPLYASPPARHICEEEVESLRAALRRLMRDYVSLMEAGRDRILDLGGSCDPIDVMEASDPALREARAALQRDAQGDNK